uniref:Uncharacterized protein n=1 Tax=Ixodes ricinus TaxID=34613 RepID=A0A6B0TYF1_IXORI
MPDTPTMRPGTRVHEKDLLVYAPTRRSFLPPKNRFIYYSHATLQCKKFMVVRVLNDENDLLSSAILPDQRAPYSSLELRIVTFL